MFIQAVNNLKTLAYKELILMNMESSTFETLLAELKTKYMVFWNAVHVHHRQLIYNSYW